MTDWSRLQEWVNDYFPESSHSTEEVRNYLKENVPAWDKGMSKNDKREIIGDWETFIELQVETKLGRVLEPIGDKSPSFWNRIKKFVGKFWK